MPRSLEAIEADIEAWFRVIKDFPDKDGVTVPKLIELADEYDEVAGNVRIAGDYIRGRLREWGCT